MKLATLSLVVLSVGCAAPKKAVSTKPVLFIPAPCIKSVTVTKNSYCEKDPPDGNNMNCKSMDVLWNTKCAVLEIRPNVKR